MINKDLHDLNISYESNKLKENDLEENDLEENDLEENDLEENDLGEDDLGENDLGENDLGEDDLGENDLEDDLEENDLEDDLEENEEIKKIINRVCTQRINDANNLIASLDKKYDNLVKMIYINAIMSGAIILLLFYTLYSITEHNNTINNNFIATINKKFDVLDYKYIQTNIMFVFTCCVLFVKVYR